MSAIENTHSFVLYKKEWFTMQRFIQGTPDIKCLCFEKKRILFTVQAKGLHA